MSVIVRFVILVLMVEVSAIPQEGSPLDHDPMLAEMAGKRDLKLYDDAGDIRELQLDAEKLAALRTFIWNHWQQRRRGYYRFSYKSVDTGGQFFVFIEPKDSGVSRVVIRRVDYWVGGGVVRRTLHDLPEVTRLERATPKKNDYGGEFVLVFRDSDGSEVYRF